MDQQTPEASQRHEHIKLAFEIAIRLGLALALVVWCFSIIRPFISVILWGVIIATALFPVYLKLTPWLRNKQGLSATVIVLLLLALILAPTIKLSAAAAESAQRYTAKLQQGALEIPPPPAGVKEWPLIGESTYETWTLANENIEELLRKYEPELKQASRWLLSSAAGAGLGILQFAASIIVAGVFLAYHSDGIKFTRDLSRRIAGDKGEKFADLAGNTVRGVAQGVLGVALIQALLAGLGFMVMGIPGAGLWTVLVLLLSVIQISPGLVLVPTIFYAFSTSGTLAAGAYMIYAIMVTMLDNVLKPILLGRSVAVPMVVIFLGAIGGFISSGIIGLFVGAVVMVVGYELFMAWLTDDIPNAGKPDTGAS